jgi:hypothetical protein
LGRAPSKPVHWFLAQSIALTLLIGFWPTPRAVYPALFHAHANALFGWLEAPRVHFGPGTSTDTALTFTARTGSADFWESSFSVVRIGYWPSAALLAMLLATPLSAMRRAAAAAVGLALVDLFTLARIAVEIAYLAHAPGASVQPAPLWLRIGSESLTATIPSAAFVLVCWVVLADPRHTIDLSSARSLLGGRLRPTA